MSGHRFSSDASDQGSTPDADPMIYDEYTTTSGYTTATSSQDPLYSSPYETSIPTSNDFVQQPQGLVNIDHNVGVNTYGLNAWTKYWVNPYDAVAAQVSPGLIISLWSA